MARNYRRATLFLCFDGEGANGDPAAAAAAAAAAAGTDTGSKGGGRVFTQEEVNKFMAEDKRKYKSQIDEVSKQKQELESRLKELSQDRSLSDEQRQEMVKKLEDLRKTFHTEKQEIEYERKQLEEKLTQEADEAKKKAEHWESLYRSEKVNRTLQDAAGSADAFNPNQIVGLLRPMTELKDMDGNLVPMIDFPDVDEKTGEEIKTLRTPADAVKRMRELPKIYGNLFKSNVVSGVGAGQGQGTPTSSIDPRELTPEQYRKMRKENPELLGLPRRR